MNLTSYCTPREMIDECDKEIEKLLSVQIASRNEGIMPDIPNKKEKRQGRTE